MKKALYHFAMLFLLSFVFSCEKKDLEINRAGREGFGLYWHHEVFGNSRHLLLDFTNNEGLRNDYDLHFEYTVKGREINVWLADATDRGACPKYAGWGDSELCYSNGSVRIPDKELPAGTYTLSVFTNKMRSVSELVVATDKISLHIPPNSPLNSTIKEVYPIPRDILFGDILYDGTQNGKFAQNLIKELTLLGLRPAEIPPHDYRGLNIENKPHLSEETWDDDKHSIRVIFAMTKDFRQVMEVVQKHYELSDRKLKIGLFSSNGDQAYLNLGDSDRIIYAEN